MCSMKTNRAKQEQVDCVPAKRKTTSDVRKAELIYKVDEKRLD